ncbi:MAG: hypothetical protein L6W00_18945 [Lentisphaeria bacterium]|nr:MAG: hypothetical protein L6W00_18945 [Lentisphaeria bacterium]
MGKASGATSIEPSLQGGVSPPCRLHRQYGGIAPRFLRPSFSFTGTRIAGDASGSHHRRAVERRKTPLLGKRGGVCERILTPGEVLFSEPLAWKLPGWDRPHELCCFVFREEFIRITYVDIPDALPPDARPVCGCFFIRSCRLPNRYATSCIAS